MTPGQGSRQLHHGDLSDNSPFLLSEFVFLPRKSPIFAIQSEKQIEALSEIFILWSFLTNFTSEGDFSMKFEKKIQKSKIFFIALYSCQRIFSFIISYECVLQVLQFCIKDSQRKQLSTRYTQISLYWMAKQENLERFYNF